MVVALAVGSSSLVAQRPVRMRLAALGVVLKRLPGDAVGDNRDPAGAPDPDENSQWLLEPIPGTEQFYLRNMGTSKYLTAGAVTATLEYSALSSEQRWNIERDPQYPVYRLSTSDGRYFNGHVLRPRSSMASVDEFWSFTLQFDELDGKPAPASVAMTAIQIAAANQQKAEDASRAMILEVAHNAQGCWRENVFNKPRPTFYALSRKDDALRVYALRFDEDLVTSREVLSGAGWVVDHKEGGDFRPRNGTLVDERGVTLALNGRLANLLPAGVPLRMVDYVAQSTANGITLDDCTRLMSMLGRER